MSITLWWLPCATDPCYCWLFRGPKGGLVLLPNEKRGWAGKIVYPHAPPADDRAEPDWVCRVIGSLLGVPGVERPAPHETLAAARLVVDFRQLSERYGPPESPTLVRLAAERERHQRPSAVREHRGNGINPKILEQNRLEREDRMRALAAAGHTLGEAWH